MKVSWSEPLPFFLHNRIFAGKKGGDARYYLQNVMDAQKKVRKSKFGTLEGEYSGFPVLRMVPLEEYERRKYGTTWKQVCEEAEAKERIRKIEQEKEQVERHEAERQHLTKMEEQRRKWQDEFLARKEREKKYKTRQKRLERERREACKARFEENRNGIRQAGNDVPPPPTSARWFILVVDQGQHFGRHVLTFPHDGMTEAAVRYEWNRRNPQLSIIDIRPVSETVANGIIANQQQP